MNNSTGSIISTIAIKHQLASHSRQTIIIAGKCGKFALFPVELGAAFRFPGL
jgi:hypothetical protein